MRLGGPIFKEYKDPDSWAVAVKESGYSASYCPILNDAGDDLINAYYQSARRANIIVAEVGAWSNPISPDSDVSRQSVEYCRKQLELAEKIGARCCVNISGARGGKWDGPYKENFNSSTFDFIVETVRFIIDAVKPKRTFYTLETMPWIFPDSPDNYLRLIKAIDRKQFGVHLDPVNLICSPQRYFANGELIHECFDKLGKYIKSCHAKDIILRESLTTHLDEVRPGTGALDYRAYLRELNKLEDIPLMLEHLSNEKEYILAGEYIYKIAKEEDILIQ